MADSMLNLSTYFRKNVQQKNYLYILKHIIQYLQEMHTSTRGYKYTLTPYIFGGFIRDIIARKDINDCDIYLTSSVKDMYLSLNELNTIITLLCEYLKDRLQKDKYEVIEEKYPLNTLNELLETYGHYKVKVKHLESNKIYTFDISTHINGDQNSKYNLFNILVDLNINNLMCSVLYNSYNDKLLFGNLELRVNNIRGILSDNIIKNMTIEKTINNIMSNIGYAYDNVCTISDYSKGFTNDEEVYEKMYARFMDRIKKIQERGWNLYFA
jgi:regulator of replication initiation timing